MSQALLDQDTAEAQGFSLPVVGLIAAGVVTTLAGCGGGGGDSGSGSTTTTTASDPLPEIANLSFSAGGLAIAARGSKAASTTVVFHLDGGTGVDHRPAPSSTGSAPRAYDLALTVDGTAYQISLLVDPDPADVAAQHAVRIEQRARLLRALGLGPNWQEVMGSLNQTHDTLIDRLVGRVGTVPLSIPWPTWIDHPRPSGDWWRMRDQLRAWWLEQMTRTSDPLTERLLMFWHNLFVCTASKADNPALMARCHRLYRQRLGGTLGDFLKAMSRDACMVRFLDSESNIKGKPNENFGRELLELFTFGERSESGAYSEADIPEVARCFTGYGLNTELSDGRPGIEFEYHPGKHDNGDKTVLGSTGNFSGDDVIDLILARKDGSNRFACARYITRRLWQEFVGEPTGSADEAEIDAIAAAFAASGHQLKVLYKGVFTSAACKDQARLGTRIKSPVELFVGLWRTLRTWPQDSTGAPDFDGQLWTLSSLGQTLFDQPSVSGWPGGTAWISVMTLVNRQVYLGWHVGGLVRRTDLRLTGVLELIMPGAALLNPTDETSLEPILRSCVTDPTYNLR